MHSLRTLLYCLRRCVTSIYQSPTYGNPYNTYTMKEEECVGCNLCKLVCPVDNCITMEVNRIGDEYINWKELQKRGLPLNDH